MAFRAELRRSSEAEHEFFHEELHAERPDERDWGVEQWHHRKNNLGRYDAPELVAVIDELKAIPEVEEYNHEVVTLGSLRGTVELARDFVSSEQEEDFEKKTEPLTQMIDQAADYVDRYADTVRRFIALSGERYRLDVEKYQMMMKTIDSSRRLSHDALMSHLSAISRFIKQKIPAAGGATFNRPGWDEYLRHHWFSDDQLKDRKYIEEWAIRTDIAEKAQALISAIEAELKNKSADEG